MATKQQDEDIRVEVGSGNVFADLGFPNAEELLLKAQLTYQITEAIKRKKLSKARASKLLGIDQVKFSELVRGRLLEDVPLDHLLRFLTVLGNDIKIVVSPALTNQPTVTVVAA